MLTTIDVKKIFDVDEVQSLLTLQLKLHLKWIDFRHKYRNLDENSEMNQISESELKDIWTPNILFANTKYRNHVNLKNETSVVTIKVIKGMSFWKFIAFRFNT